MDNFQFSRFIFEMKAVETIEFPAYKGSTLRGAFGHSFKKVVCALKTRQCGDCLLKQQCIYSYVFETPVPDNAAMMRKYPSAPHPFIILPPLEEKRYYRLDEKFEFILTLIGKSSDYLPYFIYAFAELGQKGIGRGGGRFSLFKVKEMDSMQEVYNSKDRTMKGSLKKESWKDVVNKTTLRNNGEITCRFLTPTRMKFNEDLVLDLEFHIMFRNLLRRISTLSYFHCSTEIEFNAPEMIEKAKKIEVTERNLVWNDWQRYSNRQQTKMNLGGFTGQITFKGDLEPFLPYIILGQYIHVGKGTSFGLGKYEISSLARSCRLG